VRGMLIPDEFLTEEIRATDDFKEYETTFMNVREREKEREKERYAIVKATLLSLTLHKTALAAEAQENVAKVQEMLAEEEIEKMVEGEENEESYASEFVDSMLNDDVDDSGNRIEPGSHKEHPVNVNDDDKEIKKEKKDDDIEKEKKVDDFEKMDEVVKEKDNDEVATGNLSSNKTISEELTAIVSPTTATTSKDSSYLNARKDLCHTRQRFFQEVLLACADEVIREVLDHCNKIVPEMTFAKTNEMIKEEMRRLVNLGVNKDREVDPINVPELISKEFAIHGPKMIEELFQKHMQNTTHNLYPTTSSSTFKKSSADLQQQLYFEKP
ncbi:hypothetical protein Tco_1150678, partial [Tanacetum coccineum]